MINILIVLITIILSPAILIAGFFSLVIILSLIYLFISILIGLAKEIVKQVRKWLKREDQQNIIKNMRISTYVYCAHFMLQNYEKCTT